MQSVSEHDIHSHTPTDIYTKTYIGAIVYRTGGVVQVTDMYERYREGEGGGVGEGGGRGGGAGRPGLLFTPGMC